MDYLFLCDLIGKFAISLLRFVASKVLGPGARRRGDMKLVNCYFFFWYTCHSLLAQHRRTRD